MKIWVAKDSYTIMVFLNRPAYGPNGDHMEWFGFREPTFEKIIPEHFHRTMSVGECRECTIEIAETDPDQLFREAWPKHALNQQQFAEFKRLVQAGQRLQAVKYVKDILGWGLKECKIYVDTYLDENWDD